MNSLATLLHKIAAQVYNTTGMILKGPNSSEYPKVDLEIKVATFCLKLHATRNICDRNNLCVWLGNLDITEC